VYVGENTGLRTSGFDVALLLASAAVAPAQRMVSQGQNSTGKKRVYYVAVEEVLWDYAPKGRNLVGLPHPENEQSEGGTAKSTTYLKAIYREYTDATFSAVKPRDAGGRSWASWGRSFAPKSEAPSRSC
jgi:hypothetical protein